MEYRPLGRTGVQVSKLCLGTMAFGAWGNQDHDECIRTVHQALDAGVNFVDTADMYSDGESEEIVGKAIGAVGTRSCWHWDRPGDRGGRGGGKPADREADLGADRHPRDPAPESSPAPACPDRSDSGAWRARDGTPR